MPGIMPSGYDKNRRRPVSDVKDTVQAVIAEAMTSFVQAVAAQSLGVPRETVNSTGATRIGKTVG
jgi:hypothetical protein